MVAIVLLGISIYFNFNPKPVQVEPKAEVAVPGEISLAAGPQNPAALKEKQKEQAEKKEPEPAEATKAETAVAAPEEALGFLVVDKSPNDDEGPIKVSVNQRLKGRTPIRIELAPGSYDIAFSREGKRRFRKVTVVSNREIEMVATVPK
jgi:hypothetical protein